MNKTRKERNKKEKKNRTSIHRYISTHYNNVNINKEIQEGEEEKKKKKLEESCWIALSIVALDRLDNQVGGVLVAVVASFAGRKSLHELVLNDGHHVAHDLVDVAQ